jgi:hypothetical protein
VTDTRTPIGANALVMFFEDSIRTEPMSVYISFGQWIDDADTDEYGVDDNYIFYYCYEGVLELEGLRLVNGNTPTENDFHVVDYELVYQE